MGESVTLAASGANTYHWSNGFSGQTIVVSPLINSSYTVYETSSPGSCSSLKVVTVNVSTCTWIDERHAIDESLKIYPNPSIRQIVY